MKTLRITRRRTLGSVLAICLPTNLLAAETQSAVSNDVQVPDPAFFAQLQKLVRPAMTDISEGRVLKAVASIDMARILMETAESKNWICWSYVNKPYGLSQILLGQYQSAIAPLKLAIEVDRRMRASSESKLQFLTHSLDQGIVKELLRIEYGRQAFSNFEKTSQRSHEVKDLLLDQSTSTMDANELLLHAYAMTGNFSEATALLDSEIIESEGSLAQMELPPVALEYRLIKMGAALSGAGDKFNAARAFDAALNVNLYRLRTVGEYVPTPDIQLATYSVRRLVLSAALGNTDFAGLSKDQSSVLVQKIVETKGLGVRYAERFNRLLSLSKSPIAEQVRLQLREIEANTSMMPDGHIEISKFIALTLARWKSVSPVMAELHENGLGEVFQDGKAILANAHNALGDGALIGFMAYTPLSTEKFAFGSPRYLRFCVTTRDIQLSDVGTKDIVDRFIFRLREQILNERPTQETAAKLRSLLLSGLPKTVADATSWTIEPDGALHLLPFELLTDSNGLPLILSVNIGYVTSFGQLGTKGANPRKGRARIIADPEFKKLPKFTPKSTRSRTGLVRVVQKGTAVEAIDVPSLPETRLEAAAVESSLKKLGIESETYLGKRANIHSLDMTESPRVLHVATHGILIPSPFPPIPNSSDPLSELEAFSMGMPGRNAALVVSGDKKPVLVYAADIACLPLQSTELVVLSACDTGNGTVDVGEGMASLRRAVETAGASASVTSLWSVPSEETTRLISGFYNYLAKGIEKRAALRQAKLDSMARNPDPYNWAGFVFAGQE